MVGLRGFEPLTSPLSGVRSNQLSYRPTPLRPAAIPEGTGCHEGREPAQAHSLQAQKRCKLYPIDERT
jgi:hypothetical protein